MLRLRHVYKTYQNDLHILRDMNFEIERPDLYFIKGESGSGKTTLFKLLTLMAKPTSGEIFFADNCISKFSGAQISEYRKNIGIVFQDYKLIPDLNIFENIALPMKIQKKSAAEIKNRIAELSEQLNLNQFLNEYPEHLSGGQQQKSAIARALANKPSLIFADEPTGNLDSKNSLDVISVLNEFSKNESLVLVATHDETILQKNLPRVLNLNNGQIHI
jgi:cell division transport system ATP-binding protein